MSIEIIGDNRPKPMALVHIIPGDEGAFTVGPVPELAGPIAFLSPSGAANIIGGMTTRLAVAAHLYSRLLDNHEPREASAKALYAADVLIDMERSDRKAAQAASAATGEKAAA